MKTTGRKSQEVYPERAPGGGGSGALVRVGYDNTIEEFEFDTTVGLYVPRDSSIDPVHPLQVTFPEFQFGDTLEVDFKLNGIVNAEEPTTTTVSTQIAVSVDGGGLFYTLLTSGAQATVETSGGLNVILLRSLDAIQILNPMPVVVSSVPTTVPVTAPPIVRVFFQFSDVSAFLLINGANSGEPTLPDAMLKCSELLGSSVFQSPLSQLSTT